MHIWMCVTHSNTQIEPCICVHEWAMKKHSTGSTMTAFVLISEPCDAHALHSWLQWRWCRLCVLRHVHMLCTTCTPCADVRCNCRLEQSHQSRMVIKGPKRRKRRTKRQRRVVTWEFALLCLCSLYHMEVLDVAAISQGLCKCVSVAVIPCNFSCHLAGSGT